MRFFYCCHEFPGKRGLPIRLYREFETVPGQRFYGKRTAENIMRQFALGRIRCVEPASWSVQYAGSGHYFTSSEDAFAYIRQRWPYHYRRYLELTGAEAAGLPPTEQEAVEALDRKISEVCRKVVR